MQVVDRTIYERIGARLSRLYGKDARERLLCRVELLAGRYGVEASAGGEAAPLWDQRDAVLIAFADQIRREGESPLTTLRRFVEDAIGDAVSIVHILPFVSMGNGDHSAVVDHRLVDPLFGDWADLTAYAAHYRVMLDLVLTPVSVHSAWFRGYVNGVAPERAYFIEIDADADLNAVQTAGGEPPRRAAQTPCGLSQVWTSFGPHAVDLNFGNPDVLFEFLDLLLYYVHHGGRLVRLSGVSYLWKTLGSSCKDLPESHEIVRLLRDVLELLTSGIALAVDAEAADERMLDWFGDGDKAHLVERAALAPLVLHALERGRADVLSAWLQASPEPPSGCTWLNRTALPDAIPLSRLRGLVDDAEIDQLVTAMENKGGRVTLVPGDDAERPMVEMLDISWYNAMSFPGRADCDLCVARFLCSQTLMLSLRGIPGVYFNALVGADNDLSGAAESGRAPDIERRRWAESELASQLADPSRQTSRIFGEYLRRLRLRAEQPAFHPDAPERVLDMPAGLFGLCRGAPDGSHEIYVVANLTADTHDLAPSRLTRAHKRLNWRELIQGWGCAGEELEGLHLAPWQVLWLIGSAAGASES